MIKEIQKKYRSHSNEDRSIAMSKYMRFLFPYLGIPSPLRKEISKPFIKDSKLLTAEETENLIMNLHLLPEREYSYLAMDILISNKKKWNKNSLKLVEKMVLHESWWDTIDILASSVIGHWFILFPEEKDKWLKKWISSKNMWLNRCAILHQLKYGLNTDTEILSATILPHIESKEFFHQKAIGWALREYSKKNQDWVKDFIKKTNLKPLSVREGSKYLGST